MVFDELPREEERLVQEQVSLGLQGLRHFARAFALLLPAQLAAFQSSLQPESSFMFRCESQKLGEVMERPVFVAALSQRSSALKQRFDPLSRGLMRSGVGMPDDCGALERQILDLERG